MPRSSYPWISECSIPCPVFSDALVDRTFVSSAACKSWGLPPSPSKFVLGNSVATLCRISLTVPLEFLFLLHISAGHMSFPKVSSKVWSRRGNHLLTFRSCGHWGTMLIRPNPLENHQHLGLTVCGEGRNCPYSVSWKEAGRDSLLDSRIRK